MLLKTQRTDDCSDAYLSCDGRPHFERVVVRAADDAVAAELEAGDHMVVVTFQHLKSERDNSTLSHVALAIKAADKRKMSSSAAGRRREDGVCVCVLGG